MIQHDWKLLLEKYNVSDDMVFGSSINCVHCGGVRRRNDRSLGSSDNARIDFALPRAYLRGVAASVRVPTTTLGLDHASSGSVSLAHSVSGCVV